MLFLNTCLTTTCMRSINSYTLTLGYRKLHEIFLEFANVMIMGSNSAKLYHNRILNLISASCQHICLQMAAQVRITQQSSDVCRFQLPWPTLLSQPGPMADDPHKTGLYRWKRQENPRVYSRSKVSNKGPHRWCLAQVLQTAVLTLGFIAYLLKSINQIKLQESFSRTQSFCELCTITMVT